jgi:hypothetical protein
MSTLGELAAQHGFPFRARFTVQGIVGRPILFVGFGPNILRYNMQALSRNGDLIQEPVTTVLGLRSGQQLPAVDPGWEVVETWRDSPR